MPQTLFKSILGHETIVRILEHAAKDPSVAYLFTGPDHVGKRFVASCFAKALLEMNEDASLETHPDFIRITREDGARELVIKQARALINRMQLTSAKGGRKVALIEQADYWNEESCNALLKAVEEPSARAVYLFIAEQPERLPATLRSRLTTINFERLPTEQIARELESRGIDPGQSKKQAKAAAGLPGLALRAQEEGADVWEEERHRAASAVKNFLAPIGVQCQAYEQLAAFVETNEDTGGAWRSMLSAMMQESINLARQNPKMFLRAGNGLIHAWHLSQTTLSPRLALEWAAVSPYLNEESIPSFLRHFYL